MLPHLLLLLPSLAAKIRSPFTVTVDARTPPSSPTTSACLSFLLLHQPTVRLIPSGGARGGQSHASIRQSCNDIFDSEKEERRIGNSGMRVGRREKVCVSACGVERRSHQPEKGRRRQWERASAMPAAWQRTTTERASQRNNTAKQGEQHHCRCRRRLLLLPPDCGSSAHHLSSWSQVYAHLHQREDQPDGRIA